LTCGQQLVAPAGAGIGPTDELLGICLGSLAS
jgi:hypothetical protein